jgi:hypothetical protein
VKRKVTLVDTAKDVHEKTCGLAAEAGPVHKPIANTVASAAAQNSGVALLETSFVSCPGDYEVTISGVRSLLEPVQPGRFVCVIAPGAWVGGQFDRAACRTIVQDDPCFSTGTKPTDL